MRSNDVLSWTMFQEDDRHALLDVGRVDAEADANAQLGAILAFLQA